MIEKLKNGFYFIPLGGTGEFGASLNLYVVDGEIIVVDMGVCFDNDIATDVLIPDPSLLIELKPYIKGIVLTHAHEDHYGSIPYILPSLNVPVYGSKFSIEMLKDKMKEFGHVKGKYITFLDSDDAMKPDFLKETVSKIEGGKYDIVVTNYDFINEKSDFLYVHSNVKKDYVIDGYEALTEMWYDENVHIGPWAKLYKREVFEKERFKSCYCEDSDILERIFKKNVYM